MGCESKKRNIDLPFRPPVPIGFDPYWQILKNSREKVRSRFPDQSVENAGGARGAVGKGSDEGAGLSARLGPAISGERRMTMDFLPLYLVLEKKDFVKR